MNATSACILFIRFPCVHVSNIVDFTLFTRDLVLTTIDYMCFGSRAQTISEQVVDLLVNSWTEIVPMVFQEVRPKSGSFVAVLA